MNRAVLFAPILFALSLSPALAESKCFSIRDFSGWRAPDANTIYVRALASQYYRLDLSGACPMLTEPGVHLITKTTGSDLVCTGVDWDLAVAHDTMGHLASHCIVKTMTKLTKEEVDAIPKKYKP
jgi:Family of unknown function (DUF6491)